MFPGIVGIELNKKKLQDLAIKVDKIMREEIAKSEMKPSFQEARVYNIKTVGVQGDSRIYGHPTEITIKEPKHKDGTNYNDKEFDDFLRELSTRITNEVKGIIRVVRVTGTIDDRINLYK